jgi:uncharacterized membrane protein YhaH (DUF805 family)
MTGRMGFTIRAAVTALASLVLAHNLIFIAGYGSRFPAVMAQTGHDHGWTVAALTSIGLSVSLLAVALRRLQELRRTARGTGAMRLPIEPGLRAFASRWLAWWIALTLVTFVLFVIQENLEHAHIGTAMPGLAVLASDAYPNAIAIILAVALGISLVAALLGWRSAVLIARIQAVRPRAHSGASRAFRGSEPVDRRRGSILGRRLAGRAPPLAAF